MNNTSTTLTVNKAALTVTAKADSKTYGQPKAYGSGLSASTYVTIVGLQNSDAIDTMTVTDTQSGGLATAAVGSYTLTPSAAHFSTGSAGNYNITYYTGTLTVNKAALTVTASAQNKTYGTAQSSPVTGSTAFTSSGLQNSETIGSVTLTYSGTGTSAAAAVGSTATITPSAATGSTFNANNYNITYNTGTLTVNKAALTITASAQNKTYGTAQSSPVAGSTAFTSSGLQNSETIGSVTLTYSGTGTSAAATVGSTATITPSAATGGSFNANNYNITYNTGTLTVAAAPLTITAKADSKTYGQTKTYGSSLSASTYATIVGLQNSDAIDTVTMTDTDNGGVATAAAGGTYHLTPSAAHFGTGSSGNYTITYTAGLLTVNKANATVVVTPYSVTYDGNAHSATVTSITGVNGETGATVGTVTLSTTHTAAGTYASDSWSFTGTANYNNIASTPITDTIGKATPTLSVANSPVTYNSSAQAASVSGSVAGSVSNLKYNGVSTTPAAAGTYAITANFTPTDTTDYNSLSGASAGNFVINKAGTATSLSSSLNPAWPSSNVTFTATVTSIGASGAVPTGTVQFQSNGTNNEAAVNLVNGQATLSVLASTLGHGSNTISAVYANSDGNFNGGSASLSPSQVVNTPPAAGMHFLGATLNTLLSVSASTLAGLEYDVDGDPLTITAVSATSTNGGTVSLSGPNGSLSYQPPHNYVGTDAFTYAINDGLGGTNLSTAVVTVRLGKATSVFNYFSSPVNNTVNLRGYGIPGKSYDVQESGDVTFATFTTLATVSAAANGVILYSDTSATNSPRYYRLAVH